MQFFAVCDSATLDFEITPDCQNCAACFAFLVHKESNARPIFRKLHWVPVDKNFIYKLGTNMFSIFHNLLHAVCLGKFFIKKCGSSYPSRCDISLVLEVPRTTNSFRHTGFRTFHTIFLNALLDTLKGYPIDDTL